MLKKSLFIGCLSLFIFSCSSPENVAQEFLEAMNSSQFETAMSLVTEDSQGVLYSIINQQTSEIPPVTVEVKACADLDNSNEEVTCLYMISNDVGEHFEKRIKLKKENNQWKIDLTDL